MIKLLGYRPISGEGFFIKEDKKYVISYPYTKIFIDEIDASMFKYAKYVLDDASFADIRSMVKYLKAIFLKDKYLNEKLVHTQSLLNELKLENVLQNLTLNKISNFEGNELLNLIQEYIKVGNSPIDPYLQFTTFTYTSKNLYLKNLFRYFFTAKSSIQLSINCINSVFFDKLFEEELSIQYRSFEKYLKRNDIKYSVLIGLKTTKKFNRSNSKRFYLDTLEDDINKQFFNTKVFKHVEKCATSLSSEIFFEGHPYPQFGNTIIIDNKVIIKEEYSYSPSGLLQPSNIIISADKNYIKVMASTLKLRLKKTNSFHQELFQEYYSK